MDRLVDQRAAAFRLPTSFDRPRIIFFAAIPLHVCIGLKNFAQAAGRERPFQKQCGIIKPVLARNVQPNVGLTRDLDNLARGIQIRAMGF